jgi:hypothetical protein
MSRDSVLTDVQQVTDVVGLIQQARFVVGPAGGHLGCDHVQAVHPESVDTQCRGINAGRGDFRSKLEFLGDIPTGRLGWIVLPRGETNGALQLPLIRRPASK